MSTMAVGCHPWGISLKYTSSARTATREDKKSKVEDFHEVFEAGADLFIPRLFSVAIVGTKESATERIGGGDRRRPCPVQPLAIAADVNFSQRWAVLQQYRCYNSIVNSAEYW
jgi:hypothetical protein